MHIKTRLARWIAHRLETRARSQRRALRDYQRQEFLQIQALDKRSRGLRLYAAWSVHPPVNVVQTTTTDWHSAQPHAA